MFRPYDFVTCCFEKSSGDKTLCGELLVPTQANLREHLVDHLNGTDPEDILVCPFVCKSKIKSNVKATARHILDTHCGITHECYICHSRLSRLDARKRHLKDQHGVE